MTMKPLGVLLLLVCFIDLCRNELLFCKSTLVTRPSVLNSRRPWRLRLPLRRGVCGFSRCVFLRDSKTNSPRLRLHPDSEAQPRSKSCNRGVRELRATVRSGIAVPQDVKIFGKTDVYQWVRPYQTAEEIGTLERLHAEQQETQSIEPHPQGLLRAKSFFFPFDILLQRIGYEAYVKAWLNSRAAESSLEAPLEKVKSKTASIAANFIDTTVREAPEDLELNLLRATDGTDGDPLVSEVLRQLERHRAQVKEELNRNKAEPRGGGLVVVCWLPGVSAADIKVQLALPGRHIVMEEREAGDQAEFEKSKAAFLSTHRHRDEDFEFDECFHLREKTSAAEDRLMQGAVLHLPPPLLPSLIISSPKSVRVLKWEAETFVSKMMQRGRYRDGRESEFLRFQRAFRLTWPAAWRLTECRLLNGRLVVVVPPLPKDASLPNLHEEAKIFPLYFPVQEKAAPHPPFRGFLIRGDRYDWHFNFHRFPKEYSPKVDYFAMRDTYQPPPPKKVTQRKPRVRVITMKNWMEA